MDDQLDDVHRLGRAAAGDQQAFGELFDRHGPSALGLLLRQLGDRGQAEEVLQEVFLQVWTDAGRYRPQKASPRGWILMLARSRGLDRLRARRSSRRREEAVGRQRPVAVEAVGSGRLEAGERAGELASALDALPAEQRSAIELAYFEGLSHRQLADRLGVPLGTAKSRILLGMTKLRQVLAEER